MMKVGSAAVALLLTCGVWSLPARADVGDWPMYHHDGEGTRHNRAEWRLSPVTVPHLRELWSVTTPGAVTGTPIVVDDELYVGDWTGGFYKLRARDGHHVWTAQAGAPISASALVIGNRVVFGDQAGVIYGLDRGTGALQWQSRPNPHDFAAIFGSPTLVGPYVAIGIASNEEEAATHVGYVCCSFRGSVVLLDPQNGQVRWQTYLISDAQSAVGSSGAPVWSTPTYDHDLDLIYVSTGNNYSEPVTETSDAVLALDANSGALRWNNQRILGDVSNFTYPIGPNRDADFGDSPQIYRLGNGRKVVAAGAKNGVFWVFDAATGQMLKERQIQPGGSLGGLFADSATAYGLIFANGSDWANPFDVTALPTGGVLTAFTGDAQHVLWQKTIPQSVNMSGVAVANAVVYFSSCNPGTGSRLIDDTGTLYAVSTLTGTTLATLPIGHCSLSGPAIANGRIFVGSGNMLQFATIPPGRVSAFGL